MKEVEIIGGRPQYSGGRWSVNGARSLKKKKSKKEERKTTFDKRPDLWGRLKGGKRRSMYLGGHRTSLPNNSEKGKKLEKRKQGKIRGGQQFNFGGGGGLMGSKVEETENRGNSKRRFKKRKRKGVRVNGWGTE